MTNRIKRKVPPNNYTQGHFEKKVEETVKSLLSDLNVELLNAISDGKDSHKITVKMWADDMNYFFEQRLKRAKYEKSLKEGK